MKKLVEKLKMIKHVFKDDCVVLTVTKGTLIVEAGNKSADDVKNIASTFFKKAYKLS